MSRFAWPLYKCAALLRAVYDPSVTKRDSLELYVNRREFLPGSRFLSSRYMILAVESDMKTHFFISFITINTCTYSYRKGKPGYQNRFKVFPLTARCHSACIRLKGQFHHG